MKKKRRLPIQQLRDAAKIANELLKKKGVIAQESIINEIEKDEGAPMLIYRTIGQFLLLRFYCIE